MNAVQRDELLIRLDERCKGMDEKLDVHNGDIRALKTWQARLTGAFGVLAVVVVFFQAEIVEVVTQALR